MDVLWSQYKVRLTYGGQVREKTSERDQSSREKAEQVGGGVERKGQWVDQSREGVEAGQIIAPITAILPLHKLLRFAPAILQMSSPTEHRWGFSQSKGTNIPW